MIAVIPAVSKQDLDQLRHALLAVESRAAARRAGAELVGRLASSIALTAEDVSAIFELAIQVARQADDDEFGVFVRTGRLPGMIALGPREMEHVRGGRLAVTDIRGVTPADALMAWIADR